MKASRMFKQVITACSQHINHKYDIIGDDHSMLAAHKSQKDINHKYDIIGDDNSMLAAYKSQK